MRKTLSYAYWRDGDWYVGQVRELPSVISQGRTLAELEANLKDAYHVLVQDQPARRVRGAHVRRLTLAHA